MTKKKIKSQYLKDPKAAPNTLEKEWWKPRIFKEKAERAAKEDASRKAAAKADRFHKPPIDEYDSAENQMKISRFGNDRGSIKQHLDQETMEVDGVAQTVNKTRDLLDRLYRAGEINEWSYKAGKEFKRCFSTAGYDSCKSSNLMGVGGSGGDHAHAAAAAIERTAEFRGKVHLAMEIVGGHDSPMWKAMFWLVGMEKSLNDVSKQEGNHRDVWSGFAKSALYLLGREYQSRPENRAR